MFSEHMADVTLSGVCDKAEYQALCSGGQDYQGIGVSAVLLIRTPMFLRFWA
jgi:S-adenosylmethionine/arginine decarboxylase-like enzyme